MMMIMPLPSDRWLTHRLITITLSCTNIHFTNLATWRGLRYGSIVIDNPAPPDRVVQELWTASAPR